MITDLGVLPGNHITSFATGVNNLGEVTGVSQESSFSKRNGFYWSSSTGMVSIGSASTTINFSQASSINASGHIAGSSIASTGFGNTNVAVKWDPISGMQVLTSMAGEESSFAWKINDSGQIAGENVVGGINQGFFWDSTMGKQRIGSLAGANGSSSVSDMNNLGEIVGGSQNSSGGTEAYIWDSVNGMRSLSAILPSSLQDFSVTDINDVGDFLGGAVVNFQARQFHYSASAGLHLIDGLSGISGNTLLNEVNNVGVAVGSHGSNAIIWDAINGTQNLNDLKVGTTNNLLDAQSISDTGFIAGSMTVGTQTHAYLATPVPEPASMIGLSALGLLVIRRRKKN
ncbi:MAG: PEP-CTERM sorting domain-containing protein [Armatimonadetes bacterium]|nr:PEP-CTERM sorting domain-containing protein [Armatimonadota bacterium]